MSRLHGSLYFGAKCHPIKRRSPPSSAGSIALAAPILKKLRTGTPDDDRRYGSASDDRTAASERTS
eukprot:3907778-Rhodomonas_salina.1